MNRDEQLVKVQTEARELFRKKNADYGDAFATYGTVGVLVRLGDKIHRLQSITSRGINLVKDEKLRDTLLDLHNYAAMGIMLLDNDGTMETVRDEDEDDNDDDVDYQDYEDDEDGDDGDDEDDEDDEDDVDYLDEDEDEDDEDEDDDEDEVEEMIEKIDVTGSTGNIYNIKKFKLNDGTSRLTCSCPSYKYCKDEHKTCKHIKKHLLGN